MDTKTGGKHFDVLLHSLGNNNRLYISKAKRKDFGSFHYEEGTIVHGCSPSYSGGKGGRITREQFTCSWGIHANINGRAQGKECVIKQKLKNWKVTEKKNSISRVCNVKFRNNMKNKNMTFFLVLTAQ